MEWKYRYDIEGKVLNVFADRTANGYLADDITYEYGYNNANQLSSVVYNVSDLRQYITYDYDWYNRYLSTNLSNGTKIGVDYDIFQRTSHAAVSRGSNTYKSQYVYEAGVENTMASRIEGINYSRNDESRGNISYEYDDNGNITEISKDGELQLSYAYDDQNQLIRENNKEIGQTIVYTYDAGGNIQNKKIYEYTEGEISGAPEDVIEYGYENSTWKDLMTSYDGKEITYDEIGNPLTYGEWELAWERGRQLSHLNTGEHDISYKYNESGLRAEKTVDGVRTEYIWDGSQLLYENNGSRETMYYYDAAGQLIGFRVNGSTYYYVRNVQGDIIKILDGDMEEVVEYKYDTWGNVIGMEGSDYGKWVGSLNPFRYRGYYYDDETGMYYLITRYYNPEWGRFLNADTDLFANLKNNQHNIYAYCSNNPVAFSDPSGCYPIKSYTPGIVRYEYYDYIEILHTDTGTMEVYLIDRKEVSSTNDNSNYTVISTSNRGKPNSSVDLTDKNGNVIGKRYFGPDGWAKTDEHYTDHGNPKRHKIPHKHDWGWTDDGKWEPGDAYSMPSDAALGLGIVLVASVAIAWVVVNDVTGVGVADDFALVPLSTAVATGVSMIA